MAPRYSSYPYREAVGFELAQDILGDQDDDIGRKNLLASRAANVISPTGTQNMFWALSDDPEKDRIRSSIEDLEQIKLARDTKYKELDFEQGKLGDEDGGIEKAITQALLAIVPIAGGYMLGGNELAGFGAGVGIQSVNKFEDIQNFNEAMKEKKLKEAKDSLAKDYEQADKAQRDLIAFTKGEQDYKRDREFQVQNREDQQRFQAGMQAESQKFQREMRDKEMPYDVSADEIKNVATQWGESGDPNKQQQLLQLASEVEAGQRRMPRSAFGSYIPQRPQAISDTVQTGINKAYTASLSAAEAATKIERLTNKSFPELLAQGRIPMTEAKLVMDDLASTALSIASADLAGVLTQQDVEAYIKRYATPEKIASGEGLRNLRIMAGKAIASSLNRLDMEAGQYRTAADAQRQKQIYLNNVSPMMRKFNITVQNAPYVAMGEEGPQQNEDVSRLLEVLERINK